MHLTKQNKPSASQKVQQIGKRATLLQSDNQQNPPECHSVQNSKPKAPFEDITNTELQDDAFTGQVVTQLQHHSTQQGPKDPGEEIQIDKLGIGKENTMPAYGCQFERASSCSI